MNFRKHFLEAATLIVAAILCAVVSNAIASRERKLAVVGSYPNALKVPVEAPAQPVAPLETPVVTTATLATDTATAPATATAPQPIPAATPTIQTTTAAPVTAKPTPARPAAPPPDISRFKPHPDKAYAEIGYADAAALRAAGALILDARRTSVYEQGHIAGARPFSVWEADVDDKVNKLFEERGDPSEQVKPIVVYCSGGECEDSHMLAQKLWGIQFNNVYVYRDGYPDWVGHGGPVRTGAQP